MNEVLTVAGREVAVSNPDKVYFPRTGHTKLDLVRYYLAVADGALRGVAGRPMVLKRFVNGAEGEVFFQKRAPAKRPEWIETVELSFPSGRTAVEVVVNDAAQLVWVLNLGCIDLNPHPVRAADREQCVGASLARRQYGRHDRARGSVLADVREAAGEALAEERLDGGRERRFPHGALRGDHEHSSSPHALELRVELLAQDSGAPMDRFRV